MISSLKPFGTNSNACLIFYMTLNNFEAALKKILTEMWEPSSQIQHRLSRAEKGWRKYLTLEINSSRFKATSHLAKCVEEQIASIRVFSTILTQIILCTVRFFYATS